MFAINTTDLIEETQRANESFTRQENLETLNPNVNAQLQQVQAIQNKINSEYDNGINTAFNSGIDILFNLAKEEEQQQRRREAFRARQMPRQTPTMSERFANLTKI
jgi:flagellar biosynthesis/type III secretory pathway protein FliH